jgi:SAM-dependent methyltransferase
LEEPDVTERTDETAPRKWDANSAAAWHKWFHIIEDGAQALSDRMVELAAIGPGSRVLDVASGLGEPAVAAARRAGPDGQVLATDHSEEMLGHGRKRAEKLGLDNIEFRRMDAQALAVPEAAFDAVLCRWGVMFLPDLDRALAGFRRCLKPGGRLVAAIWGPAERVPCVGLGARVVHAHLGLAPPDEGAGTPFALSDVAAFERRVAAAGFENVRGAWFNVSYVFETAAQFTQYRRDLSGPLKERMATYPAEGREAAWAALTEAARDFETPEGTVKFDNAAYCVSARA